MQHVYCVDINPQRLKLVPRFGGRPIDGRPDRYAASRKQIEAILPDGVDAVLEVAGFSALVAEGIQLLRTGGFYGFVGMVHPNTPLDISGEQIVRKCLTIRGVHNYNPRHLDEAMAFLERTVSTYPYADLVSPPYSLTDLNEAVTAARNQVYCRVSVKPAQYDVER